MYNVLSIVVSKGIFIKTNAPVQEPITDHPQCDWPPGRMVHL